MDDKVKILFYTESWGIGGIESFVMNTIQTIDRDRYCCSVFSTHDKNNPYDSYLSEHGISRTVVYSGVKPNLLKRLFNSVRIWDSLLKKNHYDVVHINTMNGVGFVYSFIAKLNHVPIRIVHSHNSSFGSGAKGIKQIAHFIGKKLFMSSATIRIACSKSAGFYLFGKNSFCIIPNGVEASRFRFRRPVRDVMRDKYQLPSDALVFGSVGRLSEAKNPLFQIDVLYELKKQGLPFFLFLIGDGPLKDEIEKYASEKGVSNNLILPGGTNSPELFLQLLDVFSMPSLFEGFPIAAVEAYANGLPLVLSKGIPQISHQSDACECHLSLNPVRWAQKIVSFATSNNMGLRNLGIKRALFDSYDRTSSTQRLERFYSKHSSL